MWMYCERPILGQFTVLILHTFIYNKLSKLFSISGVFRCFSEIWFKAKKTHSVTKFTTNMYVVFNLMSGQQLVIYPIQKVTFNLNSWIQK